MGKCTCVKHGCLCKRHPRSGVRCEATVSGKASLCAACRDNVAESGRGQGSFRVPVAMPLHCKRLRSKCSKSWASPVPIPAKANEALVHHIIISEPGAEVLPHSLWLDVLSSYVPMPQIVWMYEDIKLPPHRKLKKVRCVLFD